MDKWFENKFERDKIRSSNLKNLNSPSGFSRKLSITVWLIIINLAVFVLTIFLTGIYGQEKILGFLALQPTALFQGYFWTLLTSIFIHGGIEHILANMVSLFFVGGFLEKIIGRKRFLWLYILAGVFAGIFYSALSFFFGSSGIGEKIFINPSVFAVGASGAIFGLLGVLAVLIPKNKIYLIAGPLLALIAEFVIMAIFPSSAVSSVLGFLVTFYFIFSFFAIFSFNRKLLRLAVPLEMPMWLLPIVAIVPLIVIGLFVELPIGNTAHLGGLIAGIFYGTYLKNKYRRKTAAIRKMFGS